jgi:hypothetical protein
MISDLGQITQILFKFIGSDLTGTLSRIERAVGGVTAADFPDFLLASRARSRSVFEKTKYDAL